MNLEEKLGNLKIGKLTAEDNLKNFLARIKEKEYYNIFLDLKPEESIQIAKRIDEKIRNGSAGKLAGLVIAVKSNINVKGYRITCASKTLEDYISPYDAEVIKRIKQEDGIIIGMTNMDEFACGSSGETSYFKPTRNPKAPDYIPGGSSSGSAAAVAADLCDLALGSDTGGSIRNPASHCGVIGIKPSYGRVPRDGLIDLAMSLDQIGPFSGDVYGSALLLETIAGYNNRECTVPKVDVPKYTLEMKKGISGFRIGRCKEMEDVTDKRIVTLIEYVIGRLSKENDVKVVDISLPYIKEDTTIYYPIQAVEFFSATRRFDGRRYGKPIDEVCGPEVARRLEMGKYISQKEYQDAFYKKALAAQQVIKKACDEALKSCDVIISPTVPKLPHKLGEQLEPLDMYNYDLLTIPANLSGIAAASIPVGYIEGIPVGLQVQAGRFQEDKLIRMMYAIEILGS